MAKKKNSFASGLWRNPDTGVKLNLGLHAPVTGKDLSKQGYSKLNRKAVKGGELFYQDIGGGQQYQEFIQRPKGWTSPKTTSKFTPISFKKGNTVRIANTPEQANELRNLGFIPSYEGVEKDSNFLDDFLSQIQTPMSTDDIKKSLEEEKIANQQMANYLFDPKIKEAMRLGEKRLGSAQGQLGVTRGLGLSTAEASYLQQIEDQTQSRIKEIEQQKEQWLRTMNFDAVKRADEAIAKLQEMQNNILLKKAELALQFMGAQRAERALDIQESQLDLNTLNTLAKIPAGTEVTIGGKTYKGLKPEEVDPFFKGSDIVNLMKNLPAGREFTIVDPNTGKEITLTGLYQETPEYKYVQSYDDKGRLTITIIDKASGEIVNQIDGGYVGKTKTQPTNITLSLTEGERSDLSNAIQALEYTRGEDGKYNTGAVIDAYRDYAAKHPGKAKQFLDVIKGDINYNDKEIQDLYFTQKPEEEDKIEWVPLDENGNPLGKFTF